MAEHDDARQTRPMTTIEQALCTGVRNLRAGTRVTLRPMPQWTALEGSTTLEGSTAGALMTEYDDARQASRQCACACGALTPVRRACLWCAQQAVPTSTDPSNPNYSDLSCRLGYVTVQIEILVLTKKIHTGHRQGFRCLNDFCTRNERGVADEFGFSGFVQVFF